MDINNLFMKEKLSKRDAFNLYVLIMIGSGIFGFIYETLFYRIDLGYFVKRGNTYGPWIPIYVFGGLFITLLTYKHKEKPWKVFVRAMLVSGIIEFLTGWILFKIFNIRLWDYNVEIWNYGNINGYICLRSVLFFGISGLILVYIMIPCLIKLINTVNRKMINSISLVLLISLIIDMVVHGIRNGLH